MMESAPGTIDKLQSGLPAPLKWVLAGMGAVAGFHYSQQHGGGLRESCIVAGAAAGFLLVVLLFAGLRLIKVALIGAAVLVVINYALLIPYGYGDKMPAWVNFARSAGFAVLGAVHRLADNWGRYGG